MSFKLFYLPKRIVPMTMQSFVNLAGGQEPGQQTQQNPANTPTPAPTSNNTGGQMNQVITPSGSGNSGGSFNLPNLNPGNSGTTPVTTPGTNNTPPTGNTNPGPDNTNTGGGNYVSPDFTGGGGSGGGGGGGMPVTTEEPKAVAVKSNKTRNILLGIAAVGLLAYFAFGGDKKAAA